MCQQHEGHLFGLATDASPYPGALRRSGADRWRPPAFHAHGKRGIKRAALFSLSRPLHLSPLVLRCPPTPPPRVLIRKDSHPQIPSSAVPSPFPDSPAASLLCSSEFQRGVVWGLWWEGALRAFSSSDGKKLEFWPDNAAQSSPPVVTAREGSVAHAAAEHPDVVVDAHVASQVACARKILEKQGKASKPLWAAMLASSSPVGSSPPTCAVFAPCPYQIQPLPAAARRVARSFCTPPPLTLPHCGQTLRWPSCGVLRWAASGVAGLPALMIPKLERRIQIQG